MAGRERTGSRVRARARRRQQRRQRDRLGGAEAKKYGGGDDEVGCTSFLGCVCCRGHNAPNGGMLDKSQAAAHLTASGLVTAICSPAWMRDSATQPQACPRVYPGRLPCRSATRPHTRLVCHDDAWPGRRPLCCGWSTAPHQPVAPHIHHRPGNKSTHTCPSVTPSCCHAGRGEECGSSRRWGIGCATSEDVRS